MRPEATSHQVSLASHVRACEVDGQVVLLDLRNNRYLGVGSAMSKVLADHVQGWPRHCARSGIRASSSTVDIFTQGLLSKGLLTDAPQQQQPRTDVGEATASLDLDETPGIINARRLSHFARSAALTAWWLRWCSLHYIAERVATRRDRLQSTAAHAVDAMRVGAGAYERMRPFVFTAQEKCLYDSLALVGFLALEGVLAHWVIGVKTSPFGAHSWVQSGPTVLNDQHEYVRRFRPILVV